MTLQGKGFFIWQIKKCENGDPTAIATAAAQAGYSHVLLKIADGVNSYNLDPTTSADLVPPVVKALKARGIQAWGWHYVYGNDPTGEADKAVQRVKQLGLDGYVIDAEGEYKQPGKDEAAREFMTRLRAGLPNLTVALSSYRYPSLHPQLPWSEFLDKCDINMPQVYWIQAHNPDEQLIRCVREFQALVPFRPIIPTGAAFKEGNWSPTTNDVILFMNTAKSLNLSAANFWEWSNCRLYLPAVWEAIKTYAWPVVPPGTDIVQQYINALNTHDVKKVMAFYNSTAVHVTPSQTIQGEAAITAWYTNFFHQTLPNATFNLVGFSGTGSARYMNWTANSSAGKVRNGNDTFGLVNGKISYHYTFFTVTP